MKKVILNNTILGLNNEPVVDYTGKYVVDDKGNQVPETAKVKFGQIALDAIIRMGSQTDEDALALFNLAEKLNENLKLTEPTAIELTQFELDTVKSIMDNQPVIIKARFLQIIK